MTERITIRLPGPLAAASRAAAAQSNLDLSAWLRSLAERETGVAAGEMPVGLAAVSAERRSEISTAAAEKRWATAKKRGKNRAKK